MASLCGHEGRACAGGAHLPKLMNDYPGEVGFAGARRACESDVTSASVWHRFQAVGPLSIAAEHTPRASKSLASCTRLGTELLRCRSISPIPHFVQERRGGSVACRTPVLFRYSSIFIIQI
jgi:hypothetical protein